ncbi:TIGR03773 family transporter-associated surface protein [Streptomyces sp. YS415]|uniref:TIGR03773 family transporter-associated surface protein n=1 Tax=Streptomyces sp. YS415 TaxID=2944806 RepID=UPI00201FD103|nr:TIGR03773 family transporter-associated surface protein [Streptomyces sp. YS415]MCL7430347.1 TIGR03773 family transporter-associated surface protein [Streptomyces sp. YS415]
MAVALVATLAGSGVAAAQDGGTSPGSGPGRIAYVEGELSLDGAAGQEGTAAPVIVFPDARPADDVPAPGWDTTGVPEGVVDQDTVRWSLTGLDGPGDLKVYARGGDGEGDALLFDSADGLPDGYELPVGQEGATRWEFTAEGTYQAIFTADARTVDGRELSVGAVRTVLVGAEAADQADALPDSAAPPAVAPGGTPSAEPPNLIAPVTGPTVPSLPSAPAAGKLSAPGAVRAETVVSTPKVIDEGHIDIAARVMARRMQIHIKDGTVSGKTTWREPSSVVLHVKPAARNSLPDSDDFAFLGKPGDPVWLLDQVQQDGLLWPGWSTDNIQAGATKGAVTFSLTAVKGPGTAALYTYDAMSGATVLFNSKDGVPDAFDIPANTHAHGGWAFTKEGTYRLTFKMSGKLADGTAVSDTETVAFVVGDKDPNAVRPGSGSGSGSSSGTDGADAANEGSSGTGGSGDDSTADAGGSSDSGSGGSMASTGAGNAIAMGGTAAALAALGTAFVAVNRRRRTAEGARA